MNSKPWWGTFEIAENNSLLFSNDTFMLTIEHKLKEWSIQVNRDKTAASELHESAFKSQIGEFCPITMPSRSRHIVGCNTNTLEIMPSLADRTVVCRPISPITIAPSASVVIYLSTPIWLTLNLCSDNKTLLKEVASQQLSDTWFGSSTREGEFCYASQTNGRLDIDKLNPRTQRAITPLLIENRANSDLNFERVALPVPSLSLYAEETGQLWTQNVSLIREDDGDFAKLKLGEPPQGSQLINGPRVELGHGNLIRAFSAIFS